MPVQPHLHCSLQEEEPRAAADADTTQPLAADSGAVQSQAAADADEALAREAAARCCGPLPLQGRGCVVFEEVVKGGPADGVRGRGEGLGQSP